MRYVAPAIISQEQTQSNRVCCFQTLDAVFPKALLSDYLLSCKYYWETMDVMTFVFSSGMFFCFLQLCAYSSFAVVATQNTVYSFESFSSKIISVLSIILETFDDCYNRIKDIPFHKNHFHKAIHFFFFVIRLRNPVL